MNIKKVLSRFGPGFITGASDDDPSGIATYSQTGAQFGYTQLWTALFTFPFQTVIQEICGRIGIVTGKGLSGVIRKHYPKPVLYFSVTLLLFANTVNIGADLGAMASATQLLLGQSLVLWLLPMTVLTLILEVFVSYKVYSKFLKYLTFSLLAYIVTFFVVKQDWGQIAVSTLVPNLSLDRSYLLNLTAILGTTISPYLFFWQASEEVEEEVEEHKLKIMDHGVPKINKGDIRHMRFDTISGMFFSNIVMFFIIATAASTLGRGNIKDIATATQAAEALRPIAGNFSSLLFAIGVIGTGLLAVPVLAGSASYAISETVGWKEGLYRKFKQAHGFYGIITIATLLGLLVNFTGIPPFKMLYYTAVLNGLIAPPLMVLILLVSSNPQIMGKYTNTKFSNITGIAITLMMFVASGFLLFSFI
ncbi:MAG TPA: Nramp family divalent metal transporter [Candidatus Saccharimonadales bacterium]|nr:Nramp family divalent metal transporter [Candidatus Saccharimonadales bacterium]